jgi:hypothetical protein
MHPKTLNLIVGVTFALCILAAGYGLYSRGRQAERADRAEEALSGLQEAYKRITTDFAGYVAADSAAEVTRLALRAPVEPAVTRFVHLTDTLAYTDTVIVEAAREAVTTCSLALLACELRISTSDSVRVSLEAQVRNLEAQVAATRNVARATCSGTVPTWVAITGVLGGAAAGAWIRGN